MHGINIGTFYSGSSFMHKLAAQTKIVSLLFFIAAAVCTESLIGFAVLSIPVVFSIAFSRTPPRLLFYGLKNTLTFLCLIFILNSLFYGGNGNLWSFGIIHITKDGIVQGLRIVCRITHIVIVSSVINTTTAPKKISDALCRLLFPLRFFKIPIETFALMINIAVQFIPVISAETEKIINAQKMRLSFSDTKPGFCTTKHMLRSQNVLQRKNILPLILPVFLAAFQRADELAIAMEARGYRGERKRKIPPEKKHLCDYVVMTGSALFCFTAMLFFRAA